jgi:hypothetical protein
MSGRWSVVGHLLHQKTLRPVVGAEGEDFAFAVKNNVSVLKLW